jgi:hypothetical protein
VSPLAIRIGLGAYALSPKVVDPLSISTSCVAAEAATGAPATSIPITNDKDKLETPAIETGTLMMIGETGNNLNRLWFASYLFAGFLFLH